MRSECLFRKQRYRFCKIFGVCVLYEDIAPRWMEHSWNRDDSTNGLGDPMRVQSSYKHALEDRVYDKGNRRLRKIATIRYTSGNNSSLIKCIILTLNIANRSKVWKLQQNRINLFSKNFSRSTTLNMFFKYISSSTDENIHTQRYLSKLKE